MPAAIQWHRGTTEPQQGNPQQGNPQQGNSQQGNPQQGKENDDAHATVQSAACRALVVETAPMVSTMLQALGWQCDCVHPRAVTDTAMQGTAQ